MEQLLSTGEVAKLLGLQVYQIAYAHSTGQLAEPARRILNKRLYAPEDVRRVAEHFGVTLPTEVGFDAGKGAE